MSGFWGSGFVGRGRTIEGLGCLGLAFREEGSRGWVPKKTFNKLRGAFGSSGEHEGTLGYVAPP